MKANYFTLRRSLSALLVFFLLLSLPATNIAQKVKIINVQGPIKYNCGGFFWSVKYELDVAAPKKGFIVQQITETRDIKDCNGKQIGKDPKPYWEAWSVDSGSKTCTPAVGGVNDIYSEPSHPNTKGKIVIDGKLAFFAMNNLPPSFKPGNPPSAGILLSDTNKPAFWTPAAEAGATSHNLTITWDCCNGNSTCDLTTDPNLPVITINKYTYECSAVPTANLIRRIPAWTQGYDAAKQAAFDNIISQLKLYSDNDLLSGIQCLVNNTNMSGERYLDEMSKIYLAIRALYNVPDALPANGAHVYGGWRREAGESPEIYRPLWPMQRMANGRVVVSGAYMGYMGVGYDAVGEFNDFRTHYPRNTEQAASDVTKKE